MSAESDLYRRALRITAIALAALAVVATALAWLLGGPAAAVGALAGAAVAALAALTTQVAMIVAHTRSPQAMAGIVAFSWLGKMLVIVIALLVVQGIEDFHREAFAATAAVGLIGSLVIDMLTLRRARISYVDPGT